MKQIKTTSDGMHHVFHLIPCRNRHYPPRDHPHRQKQMNGPMTTKKQNKSQSTSRPKGHYSRDSESEILALRYGDDIQCDIHCDMQWSPEWTLSDHGDRPFE